MNALAAQFGPRMRVLGDRAGYPKYGLDVQEAALNAGAAARRGTGGARTRPGSGARSAPRALRTGWRVTQSTDVLPMSGTLDR